MNGLPLALGAVAALTLVAVAKRGSRAFGHEGHWGSAGAGIVLVAGGKILLLLRSEDVTEPGFWGIPGGAIDPNEDPLTAALRELHEETGLRIPNPTLLGQVVWDSPNGRFRYTTSVVRVPEATSRKAIHLNWENNDHRWVDAAWLRDNVDDLHPGFRASLDQLLAVALPAGSANTFRGYHGTTRDNVPTILSSGLRGRVERGRAYQAPLPGRVYLASGLPEALAYVVGGLVTHDGTRWSAHGRPGHEPGAVVRASAPLSSCVPDEDWVGELLADVVQKQLWQPSPYDFARTKISDATRRDVEILYRCVPEATRDTWYRNRYRYDLDDAAVQSRIGKTAINAALKTKRGREILARLATSAPNVACEQGSVVVEDAHALDLADLQRLAVDGSNLAKVGRPMLKGSADKAKRSPPRRSPNQDYLGPDVRGKRVPVGSPGLTWEIASSMSNTPRIWLTETLTKHGETITHQVGRVELEGYHDDGYDDEDDEYQYLGHRGLSDACLGSIRRVRERLGRVPIYWYVVRMSELSPRLRGRGLGRFMYEKLLSILGRHGVTVLVAETCANGSTSEMARRVYASLLKDYVGEGLVVSSVRRAPARRTRK